MTVASTNYRDQYVGNNSSSAFYPITFVYAAATDIRVIKTDANEVEVALVFGVDFIVDPINGVRTTVAYDNTNTITIYRDTPLTQSIDYAPNDAFPADTHESALDKLTMQNQELAQAIKRTLQLSAAAPISSPLPAVTTRFLFINDSGTFEALTPADALAELDQTAGIIANYTAVFANAAARAAAVPLFIGQMGVQLDVTGLNGIYRGTALTAGSWAQVFVGPTDIQGLTANRLLGRNTAGTGNSEQIQIGTGLNLISGILSASASAPSVEEITGAIQNYMVGRSSAGGGNAENILLGRGLNILSGILNGGSLISFDFYTTTQSNLAYDLSCHFAIWIGQAAGGKGGNSSSVSGEAGGGTGGYAGACFVKFVNVSALSTKTANVGIGAFNGGDTTYQDENGTVTAPGGPDGVGNQAGGIEFQRPGFTPATGTGGTINCHTRPGGWAAYVGTSLSATTNSIGGLGASSWFGAGGIPGRQIGPGGTNGGPGLGFGAGGGGAASNGGSTGTGGSGSSGCAIRIQFK